MAKNNNLKDLLTDVADAIREKKGTAEKINPQDFGSEIKAIQTGITPAEEKDVNFYDYDGTILYSYTWDEFQNVTEMPPLPVHKELRIYGTGWGNYTLDIIKSQEEKRCEVPCFFNTDNGMSLLHIEVFKDTALEIALYGRIDGVAEIIWGDGTRESINVEKSKKYYITHAYKKGKYVLEIPNILNIGDSAAVFFTNSNVELVSCYMGKDADFSSISLNKITTIKHITSNKALTSALGLYSIMKYCSTILGNNSLQSTSLVKQVIPYYSIGANSLFSNTITDVFIPNLQQSLGHNPFNTSKLTHLYIPDTIKGCASQLCRGMSYLVEVKLSNAFTALTTQSFQDCRALTKIKIPPLVATIGTNCFSGCTAMKYYDFRNVNVVPTLDNTNAFTGIPTDCKIVVPDALYDGWIAATNWSYWASYIVKASDFVEPTNE